MEDLREQTHARHYELYRRCRLEEMGFRDIGPETKPVSKDIMCSTCFQHPFTSHLTLSTQYRAGVVHRIGFLTRKELFF